MGALSLRLPESLRQKLGEVAQREGVSINQLISSAVAEKLSALLTEEYLGARAKGAPAAESSKQCLQRFRMSSRMSRTELPRLHVECVARRLANLR